MLQFIQDNTDTSNALTGTYDPILVILSFLVAILASYCVLLISWRIRYSVHGKKRLAWLATGSLIFGTGVWAMHFLGMLAFELPLPVTYSLRLTIVSVLPVIIGTAVALVLIARNNITRIQVTAGGLMLGAGIGIMHFTGMAAMRVNAVMLYHPGMFVLSLLVVIFLAVLAVSIDRYILDRNRFSNLFAMTVSALILGFAVSGMHYTAMTTVVFLPTSDTVANQAVLNRLYLGLIILAVTLFIIGLAAITTLVESRFQKLTDNISLLSNRLFEAIESIRDGFLIFDSEGRLLIANSRFRDMYPEMSDVLVPGVTYETFLSCWASLQNTLPNGVSAEKFVQDQVDSLFTQGHSQEEWECQDRWLYIKESRTKTGDLVSIWSDVTQMKELQLELEKRAFHDTLTGLPNRDLFHDRLEKAIAKARRANYRIAVLFLDLDGFKPVNDQYGHKAGDITLQVIAQRLSSCIREADTVARLGGDEFAVLLEPEAERERTILVANRIRHAVKEPIEINQDTVSVGVSIGIHLDYCQDESAESFVRKADAAMYDVKEHGKNAIQFFGDPTLL